MSHIHRKLLGFNYGIIMGLLGFNESHLRKLWDLLGFFMESLLFTRFYNGLIILYSML